MIFVDKQADKLKLRQAGRRIAIWLRVTEGALSGRAVARQMGLASSAAVSRHLRALEAELPKDVSLTRLFDKATRQLQRRYSVE